MNTVKINDPASGAEAEILVSLGFNCFRLDVPTKEGELQLLWAADGFETGKERPSGSGIPILFPFPGRIARARFQWRGREYQLTEADGRGNAIHGFVHTRPWRVVEQSDSRVVGQFQAALDDPDILESWPADFRITADYSLQDGVLKMSYRVENPGDQDLPWGLGTHPYFRLPLGGGVTEDCLIQVPVSTQWQLQDLLPTGRTEPGRSQVLTGGVRFAKAEFDDVFGGLLFTDRKATAFIDDPDGARLSMTFSDEFQYCVVYTPPHREAVCMEPYTCVPNPFELESNRIEAGLNVLGPGESAVAEVALRLN